MTRTSLHIKMNSLFAALVALLVIVTLASATAKHGSSLHYNFSSSFIDVKVEAIELDIIHQNFPDSKILIHKVDSLESLAKDSIFDKLDREDEEVQVPLLIAYHLLQIACCSPLWTACYPLVLIGSSDATE